MSEITNNGDICIGAGNYQYLIYGGISLLFIASESLGLTSRIRHNSVASALYDGLQRLFFKKASEKIGVDMGINMGAGAGVNETPMVGMRGVGANEEGAVGVEMSPVEEMKIGNDGGSNMPRVVDV